MKHYVNFILRKAKKPIDKETLYMKVEELIRIEKDNYLCSA